MLLPFGDKLVFHQMDKGRKNGGESVEGKEPSFFRASGVPQAPKDGVCVRGEDLNQLRNGGSEGGPGRVGGQDRKCQECGGELYHFRSGDGRVEGVSFPVSCRWCGRIYLHGREVNLPDVIRQSMVDLAEKSSQSSIAAEKALTSGGKIQAWFSTVYHRGYLHGFFRSLAYFQHHAKEGRLKRLRELWHESSHFPDGGAEVVRFDSRSYNEFERLLQLKPGIELHGKSDENIC